MSIYSASIYLPSLLPSALLTSNCERKDRKEAVACLPRRRHDGRRCLTNDVVLLGVDLLGRGLL